MHIVTSISTSSDIPDVAHVTLYADTAKVLSITTNREDAFPLSNYLHDHYPLPTFEADASLLPIWTSAGQWTPQGTFPTPSGTGIVVMNEHGRLARVASVFATPAALYTFLFQLSAR